MGLLEGIFITVAILMLIIVIYKVFFSHITHLAYKEASDYKFSIFQDMTGRYKVIGGYPTNNFWTEGKAFLKDIKTGIECEKPMKTSEIIPLNNLVNMIGFTNPEYHHISIHNLPVAEKRADVEDELVELRGKLEAAKGERDREIEDIVGHLEKLAKKPEEKRDVKA